MFFCPQIKLVGLLERPINAVWQLVEIACAQPDYGNRFLVRIQSFRLRHAFYLGRSWNRVNSAAIRFPFGKK